MKLAICNEVLAEMAFAEQCAFSASLGYQGLELAPYTVDAAAHLMAPKKRAEIRTVAEEAGTPIAGLHWLLVSPKGLSITSPEAGVRSETIDVMRRLIELCADLGGDYLVHGSPSQRRLPDRADDAAEARKRGIDAFAQIVETAEQAGITYCIEALAPPQANFITSLAEAVAIVDAINSPNLRTMIDCSAVGRAETASPAQLFDTWYPSGHVAHIQFNDTNRRGPGQGDDDFQPIIAALKHHGYEGWVAIEPLVYNPDGPATAAFSAGYVKGLLSA